MILIRKPAQLSKFKMTLLGGTGYGVMGQKGGGRADPLLPL
jgi:hypothetical protein